MLKSIVKPILAIDWDGTCMESYSEQEWIPGAVEALKTLQKKFQVHIWTARRNKGFIREILDAQKLHRVQVCEEPFKLSADLYIDDKGLHFKKDWPATLAEISLRTGVKLQAPRG